MNKAVSLLTLFAGGFCICNPVILGMTYKLQPGCRMSTLTVVTLPHSVDPSGRYSSTYCQQQLPDCEV